MNKGVLHNIYMETKLYMFSFHNYTIYVGNMLYWNKKKPTKCIRYFVKWIKG